MYVCIHVYIYTYTIIVIRIICINKINKYQPQLLNNLVLYLLREWGLIQSGVLMPEKSFSYVPPDNYNTEFFCICPTAVLCKT